MIDLTTLSKTELADALRDLPVSEWNAAVAKARKKQINWIADLSSANLRYADLSYANLSYADLSYANLRSANLRYANLRSANLSYADLSSANLRSANLRSANLRYADKDGKPLTINEWCDLFQMPQVGEGLRVGFKRLPIDRITGRDQNEGKHLIEWKPNRWVDAPDWNDRDQCGGGLHISPTATATLDYSKEPLVICVAFDPKDAVCLGDKLKVRKCKVIG